MDVVSSFRYHFPTCWENNSFLTHLAQCPKAVNTAKKIPRTDVPTRREAWPAHHSAGRHPPAGSDPQNLLMRRAEIRVFERKRVQLPAQHRSYGDDVHVEAYMPPVTIYAGIHRVGIQEHFDSLSTFAEPCGARFRCRWKLLRPREKRTLLFPPGTSHLVSSALFGNLN